MQMFGRAVIYSDVASVTAGNVRDVLSKALSVHIQQLEKKVEKHNGMVERTYHLEGRVTEVEHDVADLKAYHKPK